MGKKKRTLAQIRQDKGISRMEVAEFLGLHYNSVCRKETGKSDWTITEARKLADLFHVSLEDVEV